MRLIFEVCNADFAIFLFITVKLLYKAQYKSNLNYLLTPGCVYTARLDAQIQSFNHIKFFVLPIYITLKTRHQKSFVPV